MTTSDIIKVGQEYFIFSLSHRRLGRALTFNSLFRAEGRGEGDSDGQIVSCFRRREYMSPVGIVTAGRRLA